MLKVQYVANIQGLDTTYIGTVGRRATIICLSHFMEIVLIQLSNKTCHIAVFKVLGKDGASEFLILDLLAFVYCSDISLIPTSTTTKVSPSLPHLATS